MADALPPNAPSKQTEKPSKEFVTIGGQKVVKNSNEHLALLKVFDLEKSYDASIRYMYELAGEVPVREYPVMEIQNNRARPMVHKKHKPFHNIVLTSQIVWNGQRRMVRYYDGCTTIFADEQPKDREEIEMLMKQTNKDRLVFLDGKVGFFGDEKLLLFYMDICSWNGESPFRTRTANSVFKPHNREKEATSEAARLDQAETALGYAKKADTDKMMVHAAYLGIPTVDWDSGNDLKESEIRTLYRKAALEDPASFIKSYNDKSIETKFFLNKAWEKGLISNKINPNQAAWQSGKTICDISGLKSQEAIVDRLFEYGQTEEGEEFLIQLKTVLKS